jgi:uncharacterized protein (DUF488 family)
MARSGGAIQQPPTDTRRRSVASSRFGDRAKVSEGPINEKSKGNSHCVTLWTVGHSTRPLDDFIALLQAHGIRRLVDARTIPRSRHNPQFNQAQLPVSLESAGIQYVHMPALGGLRHAHRDSVNAAWKNASFRGFADYMQTPEFDVALEELIRLARGRPTAIMCAEAVPWRCHRSLIADALVVRGLHVDEITGGRSTRPHTLTPWACVVGDRITYPAIQHEATPIPDAK